MKKMLGVAAIAVCFLMASFGYSNAQYSDLAGPFKSLNLKITYEQHIPAKNTTVTSSDQLITVPSSLNKVVKGTWVYDPTLYVSNNATTGLMTGLWISWLDPNINDATFGQRILTMLCGGGNSTAGNPDPNLGPGGVSEPTDGTIGNKPSVSTTKTTITQSGEGVSVCWVCPSGFAWTAPTPPTPPSLTGLCNDGSSYVSGYVTWKATVIADTATGYPTNVHITNATVSAGGFNYMGEAWAVNLNPATSQSEKDCITYPNHPYCHAILTGTFSANLTPCPSGSTYLTCP